MTWRDIQHILIETAEKNDPNDAGWATNGAGHPINHKYGFGRVDAQAAVTTALTWTSAGDETNAEAGSSPNFSIPDNDPTGVSDTVYIPDYIIAEFVEVYFTAADHTYWGDLEVTLVSPSGTESVLSESHSSGGSYTYNNWRFGSVRHFGESCLGYWTLRVKDLQARDTGTFQSWTLKIYGTIDMPPILQYIAIDYDNKTIEVTYNESNMQNASIESNYSFNPTLLFSATGGSDDITYMGNNTYSLSMSSIPQHTIFTLTVSNITDEGGNPVTPDSITVNDNDNDDMPDDWEADYGVPLTK